MRMRVEIRRNSDGEIATDVWENWSHHGVFWWTEGNAGGDCNRGDWFDQARDGSYNDNQCSEGKFSVRLTNADTGEILYNELG